MLLRIGNWRILAYLEVKDSCVVLNLSCKGNSWFKILRINHGKRRDCYASQRGNKLKVNAIMFVVMQRGIFVNFYNAYVFVK